MDNKFILTILIVLIAMTIVSFVMLIIINNNKLYCKYFSRKEWNLWEKVIEKLKEYKETINVAKFDNYPTLNSFYLNIEINSEKYKIVYWIKERAVSIHQDTKCILCNFDKYHSDIAAKIIEEKIKKTFDNVNESTKQMIEESMSKE